MFTELLDAEFARNTSEEGPWINRPASGFDSVRTEPAGDVLLAYTASQHGGGAGVVNHADVNSGPDAAAWRI